METDVRQMDRNKLSELDHRIIDELTRTLTLLGVNSDLLAAVGSWYKTVSSEIVLSYLQQWNRDKLKELEERLSLYSA